ncbi:MAG: internalization-related competence protein ComEC/Rec2 [Fibrobacteres bacterium]|nr:internalization-related competence protein ComEC/Rec2 [Fibrobacterota bacterium]
MRRIGRAKIRAGSAFLKGWRRASVAAYHRMHGLYAALPMVWGCLEAYRFPGFSYLGFLATALFLEGGVGKRLAAQAFLFVCWATWLGGSHIPAPAPPPFPPASSEAKVFFELEGTVEGFPSQKRRLTFNLATERGSYRVMSDTPSFPIAPGQRLRCRAREAPPGPPTNPGQFDYPAYLRSQDLDGILEARGLVRIGKPGPFNRLIAFLRGTLERALDRSVPGDQAPLLRAAMLGATDDLDPGLVEDFKASGMLHILAISGQHVGIFALILLQVFALLRLPRKLAYLATGAALGLYVPICGMQISVLRAAIMFWSCLPAVLWERPGSALNNLGWAAAASLAFMPYQILSLGFQLSFAATFFLILYSPALATLLSRWRLTGPLAVYLVSTPALSIVIYLGVYPLLAAVVHTAAPSSILGNLATVGASSGMIVSACLCLLSGPVAPIAACFGESAGAFGAMLTHAVHLLALWPGSAYSVPSLPLGWSLALLFFVFAFPYAARTRRGLLLVLAGAAAFSGRWACGEAWEAWRGPASVAYLDVGQGDGALCRLPGAIVLIDAGPPEAGRNVILPYLRHEGINRLDLVVVTHPDLDHYGGLAYVAAHMAIGKVVYPGIEADTRAWNDLRAALAQRGVPMVKVARGQALYASRDIRLSVLSPDRPGQFSDRNDNSVVTLLDMRGREFLFTGDMGPDAEANLLAKGGGPLRNAILKVPHHGSDLSNARSFLDAVRPPVSVLSAGRSNRFGHPGPVTVAALEELDSRLFLTARDGAVTFSCGRDRVIPAGEGGTGKDGHGGESDGWTTYLPATLDTAGHHGIDAARGVRKSHRRLDRNGGRRKNVD